MSVEASSTNDSEYSNKNNPFVSNSSDKLEWQSSIGDDNATYTVVFNSKFTI